MKVMLSPFDLSAIGSALLGVMVAVIAVATLTNTRVPLITSDRSAFFAVLALGFTMCAVAGIGRTYAALGWLHPITIIGSLLGILACVLAGVVFTGRTAFLAAATTSAGGTARSISGDRMALLALTAVIVAKWALGFGKYLLH